MSVCVCVCVCVCPNSWQQLFAVRRDEQRQRDGPVEPGTGAGCRDRQTGTPDAVGHRQSGTKRQFVWKTVRELGKYGRPIVHRCRCVPAAAYPAARLEIKFSTFSIRHQYYIILCDEILQSVIVTIIYYSVAVR